MNKAIASATESGRRTWSTSLRRIGFLLILLALLVPPHCNLSDGVYIGGGLVAFIETPIWAFVAIAKGIQESHWQSGALGLSMIVGWASNFSIFLRMPKTAALFAIASPWVLFAGITCLENVTGISTVAISFLPFYPWAIGIALIQCSTLIESNLKGEILSVGAGC